MVWRKICEGFLETIELLLDTEALKRIKRSKKAILKGEVFSLKDIRRKLEKNV